MFIMSLSVNFERNVKEVELILQIYYFLKRENWYWYLAQFNILELTSFGMKKKNPKEKTQNFIHLLLKGPQHVTSIY